MKKMMLFLLLFVNNLVVFGQADSLFHHANELYHQQNYQEAIQAYESLLTTDAPEEVYFNLANAHYQQRNTAKSIYYYEKAIKQNPDFAEAKNNLKFAEKTRLDDFENQNIYTSLDIWHQTIGFFTTEEWAYFALAFFWVGTALFLLYYFSQNSQRKRLFFVGMSVAIFVSALGFLFAHQENKFQQTQRFAIVMNNEVPVKAEGRSISKTIKVINEGTKVFIEETDGKWAKIHLPDATEGWILLTRIKEI